MTFKCFSVLERKSIDDGRRIITGIATSPRPDRQLDVIEMSGVTVAADIPLFLYHDSRLTVGRARLGRPTAKGIPFEAELPDVEEPGPLRDRISEAWGMLKEGLLNAVSIGFRVLDDAVEPLKTGGLRFLRIEILELSLTPIPANPDALIDSIRGKDIGFGALLGLKAGDDEIERAALVKRITGRAADGAGKAISFGVAMERVSTMVKAGDVHGALHFLESEAFSKAIRADAKVFAAEHRGADALTLAVMGLKSARLRSQVLEAHVRDLAARVAALEAFPMKYVGVYQSGRSHKKNEVATFAGGLWICRADETKAKPGDGPDWQMCVKAGRDGRDAR